MVNVIFWVLLLEHGEGSGRSVENSNSWETGKRSFDLIYPLNNDSNSIFTESGKSDIVQSGDNIIVWTNSKSLGN